MSDFKPAVKGLAIAAGIFAVLVAGAYAVRETGVLNRAGVPVSTVQTPGRDSIPEGTWTVGVDVEPGTYRTDGVVTTDCYWVIYRAGTNQNSIVDSGPSSGRPTVVLEVGHEFRSHDCGTWVRQ